MKETRLYEIDFRPAAEDSVLQTRLVEASGPRAAERHLAKIHVGQARLCVGKRAAILVGGGVKVEIAEE
jgi:hypothetical protein